MCEWSNISTASMFCIAVNLNIEHGCLGLGSTSWSKTNLTRIHLNHALKSNKYFQCMIGKTYTVFWYFPSYLSELIYFLPTMQYKIKQSRWCPMLIILQVPLLSSPSSLYWCPTIWIACWVDHLTKHFVAMARYHMALSLYINANYFSYRNIWWSLYLTLLVRKGDQTLLIGGSTTAGDSTTAGAPFIALMFLL